MKLYAWKFDNVIEVSSEIMGQYKDSSLIRSTATERVYELDISGIRHWLRMTEKQFIASARLADSIFNVNPKELIFHKLGKDIIK